MMKKKFWATGAAVVGLSLTGCAAGGVNAAPPDTDAVKITNAYVSGPDKSYVMESGPNGMEYRDVYTSKNYYATVEWRGGSYNLPVTEKCFNSIRPGVTTTVGELKTTCGESAPPLIRPVP